MGDESRQEYDRLVGAIRKSIHGFEVRYKDRTWHQKVIGKIVGIFNPNYMTKHTTTFYPNVYFPTRAFVEEDYSRASRILAHEWVHLVDAERNPCWFSISYLLPQTLAVLSVFALLAFTSLWWLLCLVFLSALAPWPSPWRRDWEMRGYTMTMAVNYWRRGVITEATIDSLVGIFTGWGYYRMGGNPVRVRELLSQQAERITSGEILEDSEPYRQVHLIMGPGDKK